MDRMSSDRARLFVLSAPSGAGKTSLLKALGQIDAVGGGELFIAHDTRIGYLAQDPPSAGQRTLYDDLKSVFRLDNPAKGALLQLKSHCFDGFRHGALPEGANISTL